MGFCIGERVLSMPTFASRKSKRPNPGGWIWLRVCRALPIHLPETRETKDTQTKQGSKGTVSDTCSNRCHVLPFHFVALGTLFLRFGTSHSLDNLYSFTSRPVTLPLALKRGGICTLTIDTVSRQVSKSMDRGPVICTK